MSVIKRLGNLGKGLWSLNSKGEDLESKARIEALREELARQEAKARPAARASRPLPVEPEPETVEPTRPLERGPDGAVKRTL
jgi:hypothetical protein